MRLGEMPASGPVDLAWVMVIFFEPLQRASSDVLLE
jgi:hypothetical protein